MPNAPQNRDTTGRFLAGQSGNPGGRPVGFHSYIQERTADGSELTDFVLSVFRDENGYNESFNGKLRDELLNREIFYSLKEVQILTEQWRKEYNTIRPHSSLGYRPPVPETIMPALRLVAIPR